MGLRHVARRPRAGLIIPLAVVSSRRTTRMPQAVYLTGRSLLRPGETGGEGNARERSGGAMAEIPDSGPAWSAGRPAGASSRTGNRAAGAGNLGAGNSGWPGVGSQAMGDS